MTSQDSHSQTHGLTCTVCGCVCDDLLVQVHANRIIGFTPGCGLAESWLLAQDDRAAPEAWIDEREASLAAGVQAAAELLRQARMPLIYGLSRSSTPGQRLAIRLADALGAVIDTTASACHAPSIMALQQVGESTCTLGEVKNRADLIIYWGSNPMCSHPRHWERFVEPPGMFVPRGRAERFVLVVDVERTQTAELADQFLQVHRGADFEVIWALRALLRNEPLAPSHIGGVETGTLRRLAQRLAECRYGAVFFGLGLTRHGSPHANVEALLRLVTDLNRSCRFTARRMRVPGDVAGADSVLCWQTGFPFSVNLNRGYPRYGPGEYTANAILERRESDAVLLVGADELHRLSPRARQHLAETPTIVLESATAPRGSTNPPCHVRFATAVYGIHRRGTAYRMDEVPIPLPQVLRASYPADHEVLQAILDRVASHTGEAFPQGRDVSYATR